VIEKRKHSRAEADGAGGVDRAAPLRHNSAMRMIPLLLLGAALLTGGPLGKPLELKKQTPIADLEKKPGEYVGKTVQVRGKVTEVCEKMGCWMNLVDPETSARVRIKVKDGEIVFPKEAIGKMAVAEGKFVKIELTREQAIERAKHEAEENHKPFDPASITGPVTIYQIQGTGAVIE
jgi:NACalpha-BTF3-like transcription factor